MRQIRTFSSIEELEDILQKGVWVVFPEILPAFAYAQLNIRSMFKVRCLDRRPKESVWSRNAMLGEYVPEVTASQKPLQDADEVVPEETSVVDHQKITIFHELLHAFQFEGGIPEPRRRYGVMDEAYKDWERQIETHAYTLVQTAPDFLEYLLFALSTRPRCNVVYDIPAETPFFEFHKQLVAKWIKKLAGESLEFGNLSQVRLLEWAKLMDVNVSESCISSLPIGRHNQLQFWDSR